MKSIKPWGVRYDPNTYHANGFVCRCGFPDDLNLSKLAPFMVGFSIEVPLRQSIANLIGGEIFQCPKCSEYFWFHVDWPSIYSLQDEIDYQNELGGITDR